MNSTYLLKHRRFLPFFLTQFFGALNDNIFKNALVILVAFRTTDGFDADTLVNLSAGLFILPFFLFSAPAGLIADRYEKSRLIRILKLTEIVVMSLGVVGFVLDSVMLLFCVLFLMGMQSAAFGPLKYSILPQHLRDEELVAGNAFVEMATFVAILLGTLLGGIFMAYEGSGIYHGRNLTSFSLLVVAIIGWWCSQRIPHASPSDPTAKIRLNPISGTMRTIRIATGNRTVWLSVLGISWFWFYGALFLAQFPGFVRQTLQGTPGVVTVFLAVFSLGIGLGSILCEKLSHGRVELGLVPIGAFGMSVFAVDLYLGSQAIGHMASSSGLNKTIENSIEIGHFFSHANYFRILVDLFFIAISGGLFIVPLYALVQQRSAEKNRARIIAAGNILNAAFMVMAAVLAIALRKLGMSIPGLFLLTAGINACVAIYICTLVPEFLMRFLVWLLMHSIYRLRSIDISRIPKEGAAILVCNHISFVDALIISAACKRPIRFVVYHRIFRLPVLNFIFKTAQAIPIASKREDAALLEQAYDKIEQVLLEGELVCLFPEGAIAKEPKVQVFKPGIEQILKRTPTPVIPMALRGLWGSFFSRSVQGRAFHGLPRKLWAKIELVCGESMSAHEASAAALEGEVRKLVDNRF